MEDAFSGFLEFRLRCCAVQEGEPVIKLVNELHEVAERADIPAPEQVMDSVGKDSASAQYRELGFEDFFGRNHNAPL